MKIIFFMFAFGIFVLLSSIVSAECPIKVEAKTASALIAEIPSIDSDLASCPISIPSQMKKLVKNGDFLVSITDNDDIVATITEGNITSVKVQEGAPFDYKVTLSSCQLDNILSKENKVGAFAAYYLSGNANLGASGFVNKVKLWFAKRFAKSSLKDIQVAVDDCVNVTIKDNKPSNCYETYLPGYSEYSDPKVKEEWDKRLRETGNVCQTQTSEAPKGGECKYLYEQIKNNDKKWVCWYS